MVKGEACIPIKCLQFSNDIIIKNANFALLYCTPDLDDLWWFLFRNILGQYCPNFFSKFRLGSHFWLSLTPSRTRKTIEVSLINGPPGEVFGNLSLPNFWNFGPAGL